MKRVFRFVALAVACASLFAPLTARAADLYTVRGVHVDETAKSATAARTIAQTKGQRMALTELMKRLTRASDWPGLPQVDDNTAQDAVRGFQVASEKTSSTRYIADLNVSFQPTTVRRLLARSGIAYGETQAKPALLLAVYEKPGMRVLWEDPNPWRDAIGKLDLVNAITPLIMPLGDVQEFTLVTTAQALSGDKAALANLGQRYGADEVIVASAVSNADGSKVDVTVNRYSSVEAVPGAAPQKNTYASLDAAAAGVLAALGEQWKSDTIVQGGTQAQLTAAAYFTGLDQWETIRKGLSSTPLVNGLQVSGIAANGAEVQINYRGTPEKLALSLAQANISLSQDAGGWSLRAR
ncbi:MAG TPA: DUF2066 domain-containing protein [Parvibaculum sp.]|jgi:hypothetical protein